MVRGRLGAVSVGVATKRPYLKRYGLLKILLASLRQLGRTHEELIALAGDRAAFVDRPDDE